MLSAVAPSSNGFGGGSYTPAGRPTAVGGSLGAPGTAASTPPGVPSSGIIEARNNKGSNVQVPYARLVPMHSRDNIQASAMAARADNPMMKDTRLLTVNGTPQLEYDGLQQGELAWILGRRFKSGNQGGQGADQSVSEYSDAGRYTQQAFAGLGSGVDRMQRLASTGWVESLFRERIGNAKIALHQLKLNSPYAMAMDSSLADYKAYLAGAGVLHCPDITWWRARIEGKETSMNKVGGTLVAGSPNRGRRLQGINVIDTSPFLRGVQVDSNLVRFTEKAVPGVSAPEDMPRNLGDNLCMSVLETELRRRNIMDWTPDGIVLSKLESPTDEPMKSTAIDARQAQLFNVGIQGPSITKSWTSDVKDHKLEVQPMDKVFIAVVARLSYRVSNAANTGFQDLRAQQQAVLKAMLKHRDAVSKNKPSDEIRQAATELKQAVEAANAASNTYDSAVNGIDDPKYDRDKQRYKAAKATVDSAKGSASQAQLDELAKAKKVLDENWDDLGKKEVDDILDESGNVRTNQKVVSKAYLSEFRLIRTTSSHMSNYSHFKLGNENSRMGLPIGAHLGTNNDFSGVKDVIVGAWCVGTVVDSAASRSTIGFQTVKSHPTSMAININVNIQWWSGDKLYKHFHDASGLTLMRGQKRPLEPNTANEKSLEDQDKDVEPAPANAGAANTPTIGSTATKDNTQNPDLIPPLEDEDITPGPSRVQRPRTNAAATSAFAASAAAPAVDAARVRPGQSRRA